MGSWISSSRDRIFQPFAFPAPTPSYKLSSPGVFMVGQTPCIHFKSPNSRYTLLYSHGNGGDMGIIRFKLESLAARLGIDLFLYEYPGYGPKRNDSSSSELTKELTTEEGCYSAIDDAYGYLVSIGVPSSSIILYGTSVGTGPTVDLGRRLCMRNTPPKVVILEAPFKSAISVVSESCAMSCQSSYSPLAWSGISLDIFDNYSKVGDITCPLVIFHGDSDEVVPFDQGCSLWRKARRVQDNRNGNRAMLFTFPGATHNNIRTDYQNMWIRTMTQVIHP